MALPRRNGKLVKPFDHLTAKQRRFVDEYMIDFNVMAASKRAGYKSSVSGKAMLSTPAIQDEIARRQRIRREKYSLNENYVIHGLMEQAEFYGDGASHASRITALVKLGEHLGLAGFQNKLTLKHTGDAREPIQVSSPVHELDLEKLPLDLAKALMEHLVSLRQEPKEIDPSQILEHKPLPEPTQEPSPDPDFEPLPTGLTREPPHGQQQEDQPSV